MPVFDEQPWRWFDFGETGVHIEWIGRVPSGCRLLGAVRVFERVPVSLPWQRDAQNGQPWDPFTWSCLIIWDGVATLEVKLVERGLPLSRVRILHQAARKLAARTIRGERWDSARMTKRALVINL